MHGVELISFQAFLALDAGGRGPHQAPAATMSMHEKEKTDYSYAMGVRVQAIKVVGGSCRNNDVESEMTNMGGSLLKHHVTCTTRRTSGATRISFAAQQVQGLAASP